MTVFISHSFHNKPEFDNVAEALSSAGVSYWNPEHVKPGLPLREQLRQAVETCDICIFIATRSSLQSSWCGAELGAFWGAKKTIIVYLAEASLKEEELPPIVQGDVWERRIRLVAQRALELGGCEVIAEPASSEPSGEEAGTSKHVSHTIRAIGGYLREAEVLAAQVPGFAFALMQTLSSWRLMAGDWSKAEVKLSDSSTTKAVVRRLYAQARRTVFSTCAQQYLAQWNTPHGDALLRAHLASVAKVTRVFLFSTFDDIDVGARRILRQHAEAGIDVRIFINDETAFNFPPEISQDFTCIDDGAAIGVTTAFTAAFTGEPQTQAAWYFDNANRIHFYKQMIQHLTADDVLTYDKFSVRSSSELA